MGVCAIRTVQRLHRIAVHTFKRSSARWTPRKLVFGHRNAEDARGMAERIREMISKDPERPRSLLVGIVLMGCLRELPCAMLSLMCKSLSW